MLDPSTSSTRSPWPLRARCRASRAAGGQVIDAALVAPPGAHPPAPQGHRPRERRAAALRRRRRASSSSAWPISRRSPCSTICASCTATRPSGDRAGESSAKPPTRPTTRLPPAPRGSRHREERRRGRGRGRPELEEPSSSTTRRGADHPPGELAAVAGGQGARVATSTSSRSRSELLVRFRIDGVLQEVDAAAASVPERDHQPRQDHGAAEHRREAAAAGRPHPASSSRGREIDIRVSTIPMPTASAIVMRLLDKGAMLLDLDRDRHAPDSCADVPASSSTRPHGIVLVTGPTGSGKTTTLYCGARRDQHARPQDHHRSKTRSSTSSRASARCQVNPKIGLTFAAGAALVPAPGPGRDPGRRDPRPGDRGDRDPGVAHRPPGVLARCTPTTPPSAFTRLVDMGVEPFLVAASLHRRCSPSGWCARSARTAARPYTPDRRRARARSGCSPEHIAQARQRRPSTRRSRLRACNQHGLPRPHRHLRAPAGRRRHPRAGDRERGRPARSRRPRSRRACSRCSTTARARCSQGETTIAEVLSVTQEEHRSSRADAGLRVRGLDGGGKAVNGHRRRRHRQGRPRRACASTACS